MIPLALIDCDRRMVLPARYPILPMLLALMCVGCAPVTSEPASRTVAEEPSAVPAQQVMRDLTAAEKSILADGFAAGLEDPDSVRFRWTKVPKSLPPNSFEYCGLINLKNGTSYTGMKPFLATIRPKDGNISERA